VQDLLVSSQSETSKLRDALDELTGELARERFGRRREVALRLALLGREEVIQEGLARWRRRAKENLERVSGADVQNIMEVYERMINGAEELLEALDGENTNDNTGPLGRIIVAQDAVRMLSSELATETERRLELERLVARAQAIQGAEEHEDCPPSVPPKSATFQGQADVDKVHASAGRLVDTRFIATLAQDNINALHQREDVPSTCTPVVEEQGPPHTATMPIVPERSKPLHHETGPSTPILLESIGSPHTISAPALAPLTEMHEHSIQGAQHALISQAELHEHDAEESAPPVAGQIDSAVVLIDPTSSIDIPHSKDSTFSATPSSPLNDASQTVSLKHIPEQIESDGATARSITSHIAFPAKEPEEVPVMPPEHNQFSPGLSSEDPSQPTPAAEVATILTPQPDKVEDTSTADGSVASASTSSRTHLLLADLRQAKTRYDGMQRAFRDCHVALKALHGDLGESQASSSMISLGPASHSPVLRAAIERLSDFTEDARVELEIRIADEERTILGYETLLSVPGALTSAAADDMTDVESEIRLFVTGEDSAVQKALRTFGRKLEDAQHDIAAVKRAMHESPAPELDQVPPSDSPKAATWSWTGGLFGVPSRSPSPAPTFGSVVTQPRLRHQSSSNRLLPQYQRGLSAGSPGSVASDPFAELGLRIPMPSHMATPGYLGSLQTPSQPRPRTMSGMYMLGLGSGALGSRPRLPTPSTIGVPALSPTLRRESILPESANNAGSDESDDNEDGVE
jgi:hypothetical protein